MKRIILADDDPGIQDVVKLILERAGYEVTVYPNGEMLLENNFEVPDIFLLDKQLSGVDGLEVSSFLKQQNITKDVPVIMLSASPYISQLAKGAGADDFLEKPFKVRDLLDMVDKYAGV